MRTAAARTTTNEGPTRVLDPPAGPRFDGLADWYDAEVRRLPLTTTAAGALLPGYRHAAGTAMAPASTPHPARVGAHHLPLADLIEVFLGAGLTLRRIEEPGEDDYPFLLVLVLER